MSQDVVGIEKKISVYISLVMAGIITIFDLQHNGTIDASKEIVLAFIAFAGGRQLMKSFLKK